MKGNTAKVNPLKAPAHVLIQNSSPHQHSQELICTGWNVQRGHHPCSSLKALLHSIDARAEKRTSTGSRMT